MTRLISMILQILEQDQLSITFESVIQYVAVLIGGLIVFQLQRIIVKFNTLIMDVELGKKDHIQTREKLFELNSRVEDVDKRVDLVEEKQTNHEIRIRKVEP